VPLVCNVPNVNSNWITQSVSHSVMEFRKTVIAEMWISRTLAADCSATLGLDFCNTSSKSGDHCIVATHTVSTLSSVTTFSLLTLVRSLNSITGNNRLSINWLNNARCQLYRNFWTQQTFYYSTSAQLETCIVITKRRQWLSVCTDS